MGKNKYKAKIAQSHTQTYIAKCLINPFTFHIDVLIENYVTDSVEK